MFSIGRGRFGPLGGALAALPPFPGKLRLVDWAADVYRWRGTREVEFFPWPGIRFSVDLSDRIQREMWSGCYEPHVTRCLEAILRPGDTFLDAGAHIGYHSLFAARLVENHGSVFAFEADPGVYSRLARNLEQFPRASAFRNAVWERDACVTFERSATSSESGWGKLTAVQNLGAGEQVQVQAISLDSWSRTAGLQACRMLKLDVEGSEPAVLRGAQAILHRFRPVLLLELNDTVLRYAGSSPAQLGAELFQRGYQIYQLFPGRFRRLNPPVDCSFADCLCLPEEPAGDLLKALGRNGLTL
jgi:FkbM family methyltransferase